MKKICALLVLAIFLISLMPAAVLAKEEAKRDTGKKIIAKTVKAAKEENLSRKELKERLVSKFEDIREHQKEQLMNAVEKCKEKNLTAEKCEEKYEKRVELVEKLKEKDLERLKRILESKAKHKEEFSELKNSTEFKAYKERFAYKARAIVKTKLVEAKGRFLNAKEKYSEAKEKYADTKLEFQDAKEKIAECKDQNATECAQLEDEIRAKAKEHLLNIADVIIENLNKIKSKAESSEDLVEEDAKELIEKIDAQIQEIEGIKAKIEAAETKEEITEAAKELKDKWALLKENAEVHAGRVVNARIGGIIVKSKQLEDKLNKVLERMAEKGIDTSSVESLIAEFNAKIDSAAEHYKLAVEKFEEAKAAETPGSELINEAQGHMKEAHKALQEAQQILKDITSTIKQSGGGEELEESEEEEASEEVGEETKEETKVEFSGNVELSAEAQATLDELEASFAGVKGKAGLELKIKKQDGEVAVEKDKIEGTLTTEQQALWDSLKEQATILVESAEGDDLELEIEIEHELETEDEEEITEEEATETEDVEDEEDEEETEEEDETETNESGGAESE